MNDIQESDIGRKVLYSTPKGFEEGVIVAFNSSYVFVRYGSDVNSKATRLQDIELLAKEA